MGKDDPCSSKTVIRDSTSSKKRKKKRLNKGSSNSDAMDIEVTTADINIPNSPSTISRNNSSSRTPSPHPTFKCLDEVKGNPIADLVSVTDFENLLRPKGIPPDPESVQRHLANHLLKDKPLPRNLKSRKQYTSKHIADLPNKDSATFTVNEDNCAITSQIADLDDGDEIIGESSAQEKEAISVQPVKQPFVKIINENVTQQKISFTIKYAVEPTSPATTPNIQEPSTTTTPNIQEHSVMQPQMTHVQHTLERNSRTLELPTSMSNDSDVIDLENESKNANLSPAASTSENQSILESRAARAKSCKVIRRNLKPKKTTFECTWIDPNQMKPANPKGKKKWTFLSKAENGTKIAGNRQKGMMFHEYRLPGKPEPFSKESAKYCVQFVDTKAEYGDREREYWKRANMGAPPHEYLKKECDGKPKKAIPAKEYFQRILGGRPRSNSCSTFSEYEQIYNQKNRLDKPSTKKSYKVHPNELTRFFGRRSKSADKLGYSRTQLFTKYIWRKFNVANLNLEAQFMFSFLRKYDEGKYYQTFAVFWAEYHKILEEECKKSGKEFVVPTIWNVIPYAYKRLSDTEAAKIAPEPSRMNSANWIIDLAERILKIFQYDAKPMLSIIQPMHDELLKDPLINSAAKNALKHQAYENFSLKQFFINYLNGNKEAHRIWQNRRDTLVQARLVEKRFLGIEGINDFLPPQFRAKTVSKIPEDHVIFLNDQTLWMNEQMVEIREREEAERLKEEEKERRAKAKEDSLLAEEVSRIENGLETVFYEFIDDPEPYWVKKKAPPKKPAATSKGRTPAKPKGRKQQRGRKRKHAEVEADENSETPEVNTQDRDFSPELSGSYLSQRDNDQSLVSESFALDNTMDITADNTIDEINATSSMKFDQEKKKKVEFTAIINMQCLPQEGFVEAVFTCPQKEEFVCEPFITKPISKEKASVEATFKAPTQIEARVKTITSLTVSEPSYKNAEVDNTSLVSASVIEHAQIQNTISAYTEPVPNVEVIKDPAIGDRIPEEKDICPVEEVEAENENGVSQINSTEAEPQRLSREEEALLQLNFDDDDLLDYDDCEFDFPMKAVNSDNDSQMTEITVPEADHTSSSALSELSKINAKDVIINQNESDTVVNQFGVNEIVVPEVLVQPYPDDLHVIQNEFYDGNMNEMDEDEILREFLEPEAFNNGRPNAQPNLSQNIESQLLIHQKEVNPPESIETIQDVPVQNVESQPLIHQKEVNPPESVETIQDVPVQNVESQPLIHQKEVNPPESVETIQDVPVQNVESQPLIHQKEVNPPESVETIQDVPVQNVESQPLIHQKEVNPPESVETIQDVPVAVVPKTTKSQALPEDSANLSKSKQVEKVVRPVVADEKKQVADLSPLTFDDFIDMTNAEAVQKILPYTTYLSFNSAFNGITSFKDKHKQILNKKRPPYHAFKTDEKLVINCGKVGNNGEYCQAVITSDDYCRVYYYNSTGRWIKQKELIAENILLFDQPCTTYRSQIGSKYLPPPDDNSEYEMIVYKHYFGNWVLSGGAKDIYCYYTLITGKLILLFEEAHRYLFDLSLTPCLHYFKFRTKDNHVFKDIVIENYNQIFNSVNPPESISYEVIQNDNFFYIRKDRSENPDIDGIGGKVTSSSQSDGFSSTSSKQGSTSQGSQKSLKTTPDPNLAAIEEKRRKERKHKQQNHSQEPVKKKPAILPSCSFDSDDKNIVLDFHQLVTQPLKYHRRLHVDQKHAFLLEEHEKLIVHYAKILEAKIRENSEVNNIQYEKLHELPNLMIKLGASFLFTETGDRFSIEPVDEKFEDKTRTFMGNIVAGALCNAMRILTSLFTKASPTDLDKMIIDFHTGERFKSASFRLTYCNVEPVWGFLDNALALCIFEYSKDTSTLTFHFIRHLVNAFQYFEMLELPEKAYLEYYANVIDFKSPFYFAERILYDTMEKFYKSIANLVEDMPIFPPEYCSAKLVQSVNEDSKLSQSVFINGNVFCFQYQCRQNRFRISTKIPREMFTPDSLKVVPLEIRCHDTVGNDYFMDPIIPRLIFLINKNLIIHPTTYQILFHLNDVAEIYLYSFNNVEIPFMKDFCETNGKFNLYQMLKAGIPMIVTDICHQMYLHTEKAPFNCTLKITGFEEAKAWLENLGTLEDDCKTGMLHLVYKTLNTILRARNALQLISKEDSEFQTISTDVMRRFRLHESMLNAHFKVSIAPAEALHVKRASYRPYTD